jgi:flotillin
MFEVIVTVVIGGGLFLMALIAIAFLFNQFYRKVGPEEALVRSGLGGLARRHRQRDSGIPRDPSRRSHGSVGQADRDPSQGRPRADLPRQYAGRHRGGLFRPRQQRTGRRSCRSPSRWVAAGRPSGSALIELFDAKFSEALKTVGKRFDFVELYEERDKFKEEIIKVIGTDLNGYVLDDCAIDYLEQTSMEMMDPQNILDAEGIKKIVDLTAREHILANEIAREKEKTIKKQDVLAREAILELERQQIEAEEKQKREVAEVTARQEAEARMVEEQERLKAESARIRTDEELAVADQNKERQVIVATRNKERTDAVERERVVRDRDLEATERERVVSLAQIDKDKAIEVEKRNIQEVIRERVVVERSVVEEQEKIKDTEQFAGADRQKRVTNHQGGDGGPGGSGQAGQSGRSSQAAAALKAEQVVIEAEADRQASEKQMQATKMLAEAKTADEAAIGLAEANVMTAKAAAKEKDGTADAVVLERKAVAQAKGVEAMAEAKEKDGTAEAKVMQLKFSSEAQGIEEKAAAMKLFDSVGKEHEEFKLQLNKQKDIELAAIAAQREIAEAQAGIVGEALKSARIDIVGGETTFFDKIVDAIKSGKAVDRWVQNSETLTDVKNTFFNGNPDYFRDKLQHFFGQFSLTAEDVKDLSVAALIAKMMGMTDSDQVKSELNRLLDMVKRVGLGDAKAASLNLQAK